MKLILLLLATTLVGACEQTFNLTTPTAPTPGSTNITNTNTNTNTATNNNADKTGSDTGSPSNPSDPVTGVIPLPTYGESITRSVASSNPSLLLNSCQTTSGESAWQFLDLVIRTLRAHNNDDRWGYLCKDSSCSVQARDIVAYRASSSNTGIWIVDVIGNHCPLPGDTVEVRWGVLPFETSRPWIGVRR